MESLWQSLCKILVNVSAETLPLSSIEPLLCAAFRSTRRQIVNLTAETWNQIYKDAEHIEYPETLRTVLASLGSSVEIARPDIEIIDYHDSSVRLNFTESQDHGNHLPLESPARFQPTPLSRPSASSRSATPGSAKAPETRPEDSTPLPRKKSKGRAAKAKLRHEDSQVQFAAIESSPALFVPESQPLTDRQKEIRERQRETAAMFPALRSSPTEKTKKALATSSQPNLSLGPFRASTPDHDTGSFDDCLTSTPTPRRGQAVSLPEQDQELTDPPSSPPEPRSFRLLAELKGQTSKTNAMDDWHFSSSPVSGSPNQTNLTNLASQSMDLDQIDEELQLGQDNTAPDAPVADKPDATSSQLVIEDTVIQDQPSVPNLPASTESAIQHVETTPSGRKLQASLAQVTPRSDNEEFVDARASPMPPTPIQTVPGGNDLSLGRWESPHQNTNNQSFDVSISFENGLRNLGTGKIEIPLRSSQSTSPRKREYASYKDILPQSPDQIESQLAASQSEQVTGAMDVIEVAGDGVRKSRRGRPRKSRRGSSAQPLSLNAELSQGPHVHVPSTPIEQLAAVESQANFDNVSPGSGMWWRKRKRSVSSVYSSGGSKKARHEDTLAVEGIQEEAPDSPFPAGASLERPLEMQTMEDIYQKDVSFASSDSSSPIEHTTASQELPLAADEQRVDYSQLETEADPVPQIDVAEGNQECPEDIYNYTDDEEAVHSQLAREEEESASRAASPARHIPEPAVQVLEGAEEDQNGEAVVTVAKANAPSVDEAQQVAHEPQSVNSFEGLMNMFRNGLDKMRATDLTREQVYEVEDLMFEMRRELLQAEKRGRE